LIQDSFVINPGFLALGNADGPQFPNVDALDSSDAGTLSSDAFVADLKGRLASCAQQKAMDGVPHIAELDDRPPFCKPCRLF